MSPLRLPVEATYICRMAQALQSYVEGFRQRVAASAQGAMAVRAQRRMLLGSVVELLVRDFGATRIVLFGSLARDEGDADSDVDLLVDGISPAELLRAEGACARVLRTTVDLVPRERALAPVLERIASEGVTLYDA